MSRTQLAILILTMPFWLGMFMVLWDKNPLFILVPCGMIGLGLLGLIGTLLYAAEIKTGADWDLLIRSVLHRLGFAVQAPKSLYDDIELDNAEMWHNHSIHQDDTKEESL